MTRYPISADQAVDLIRKAAIVRTRQDHLMRDVDFFSEQGEPIELVMDAKEAWIGTGVVKIAYLTVWRVQEWRKKNKV